MNRTRTVATGLAALGLMALGAGWALRAQVVVDAHNAILTNGETTVALNPGNAVGRTAPDFALLDQNNKQHRLSELKGKTVVLAFYPADMTPGCSLQARNLTQALPDFEKRGVQVFGISTQDVASKKQFCDKDGIKHSLLADADKKVSRDYGVLMDNGMARRVSFIIAPDGKIAAVDSKVNVQSHARDLLALLDTTPTAKTAQLEAMQKVALDKAVAPFALPDYDGKQTAIGDWSGKNGKGNKATVLIFVSTQCPVSRAYDARMAKLAKDYSARGVRFFGINSNKAEAPAGIKAHAQQSGFSFPVLKDERNVVADRFEAGVTPEAYVIDGKGVLRYWGRIDDSQDEAGVKSRDLQAALDALLADKPVAVKKTSAFGCSIKRVEKGEGKTA